MARLARLTVGPGTKERILASARGLFRANGFRVTGVDAICAHAGVSKESLYRFYRKKDDLIAAVLAEHDTRFWDWWEAQEALHPDSPRAKLTALMTGLARQIEAPDFRGCPFLQAATEFADDRHPAHVLVEAHQARMHTRVRMLLPAHDPRKADSVASQIVLLINGAYATRLMGGRPDLVRDFLGGTARLAWED